MKSCAWSYEQPEPATGSGRPLQIDVAIRGRWSYDRAVVNPLNQQEATVPTAS